MSDFAQPLPPPSPGVARGFVGGSKILGLGLVLWVLPGGGCAVLDVSGVMPRPRVALPASREGLRLQLGAEVPDAPAGVLRGFRQALDNGFRAAFGRSRDLEAHDGWVLSLERASLGWALRGRGGAELFVHYAAELRDAAGAVTCRVEGSVSPDLHLYYGGVGLEGEVVAAGLTRLYETLADDCFQPIADACPPSTRVPPDRAGSTTGELVVCGKANRE